MAFRSNLFYALSSGQQSKGVAFRFRIDFSTICQPMRPPTGKLYLRLVVGFDILAHAVNGICKFEDRDLPVPPERRACARHFPG